MLFGVKRDHFGSKMKIKKMILIPKEIIRESMDQKHVVYNILNTACFSNNYLHMSYLGQTMILSVKLFRTSFHHLN